VVLRRLSIPVSPDNSQPTWLGINPYVFQAKDGRGYNNPTGQRYQQEFREWNKGRYPGLTMVDQRGADRGRAVCFNRNSREEAQTVRDRLHCGSGYGTQCVDSDWRPTD
jgi:hypothetical protein